MGLSLVEVQSWAYSSPGRGAGLPFDGGGYKAYLLPGQVDGGLVALQCPARRTTPLSSPSARLRPSRHFKKVMSLQEHINGQFANDLNLPNVNPSLLRLALPVLGLDVAA